MQRGATGSIVPSDLRGLCRFLTNTQDDVTAFSDTDIDALLNIESRLLQTEVLKALFSDWKENTVDGSGTGSINLTGGDNSVAFPTDMLQIDRIEISYTGQANSYRTATIVPLQGIDQAMSNTSNNAAIKGSRENPIVVIRNKVLYIDPIPPDTVSGGLKVWGQTLVTDLSAEGHEPVWEEAFHEILSYGSSARWLAAKEQHAKGDRIARDRQMKLTNMIAFYSNRVASAQPRMTPAYRSMR